MTAYVWAVANQKGGVAKTTSAAALGAVWADMGLNVLLVDWDPQASLTFAVGAEPAPTVAALARAYALEGERAVATEGLPALAEPVPNRRAVRVPDAGHPASRLHLLPGHIDLAAGEAEWHNSHPSVQKDHVLEWLLAAYRPAYDHILVDCPPALGLLTVNALRAADFVIVPCAPEALAVQGLERLALTMHGVRLREAPRAAARRWAGDGWVSARWGVAGIIPTLVRMHQSAPTNSAKEYLNQMQEIATFWRCALLPSVPALEEARWASGSGIPIPWQYPFGALAAVYREIARTLLRTMIPQAESEHAYE